MEKIAEVFLSQLFYLNLKVIFTVMNLENVHLVLYEKTVPYISIFFIKSFKFHAYSPLYSDNTIILFKEQD